MEISFSRPIRAGQICKIVNPKDDEDPEDVYLVSEDPGLYDDDSPIYVTSLKDLQRNIDRPILTPQIAVIKNDLTVIADNLEDYIATWNK